MFFSLSEFHAFQVPHLLVKKMGREFKIIFTVAYPIIYNPDQRKRNLFMSLDLVTLKAMSEDF